MQTNSKLILCESKTKVDLAITTINFVASTMDWIKRTQKSALFATLLIFSFSIPPCRLDAVMNNIRRKNFPCEKHTIQTSDGYILTLHRIPPPKSNQNNEKIILLMHGLSDSAQAWVEQIVPKPTAFLLSESGFDVWLINARGNVFSQNHTHMNASDPNYWNFSWHEIGVYDIPATIDYILELTNQTKLAYAGVSQGGTVILVTLSELPEYNDKISVAHLMAPAVMFKHFDAPIPKSLDLMNLLGTIFRSEGVNDLTPISLSSSLKNFGILCTIPLTGELCKSILFTIFGPSVQYFDGVVLRLSKHYPAGSSYKQFLHYGQLIATGKFQKFHYNATKNMELYGSEESPEYDLSKITANMHILCGTNDRIASIQDTTLLMDKLNSSTVAVSKFPGYNHIDFTYGRSLKKVHKKLLKVLNRFY